MKKVKLCAFEAVRLFLGFCMIFPILLALIVAFMPKADILEVPFRLTLENATLQNYIEAFQYLNLGTYMKNTFVMIIVCIPARLLTALLAAYAFSHFDFPFKGTLFAVLLMVIMIPGQVLQVTLFKMILKWNMIDTYAGLTITGLIDVSAVFLFRQTMQSTPKELREAATIDGCGDMRYFVSILVPMCKTIIVTYALRAFVNVYNSYMWPLLVTTRDEMRTVQTGVASIAWSSHDGLTLAAATITSLIPLLIYFFGMDKIVEGMTAGAVKS